MRDLNKICDSGEEAFKRIADLQVRPYLSVAEASYLYGLSQDTIRRLIADGRIPAINFGKRLTRINRRALEQLFQQKDILVTETRDKEIKEQKRSNKTDAPLLEGYCTITDLVNKYRMDQPRVSFIVKKYKLPKIKMGRYTLVPKDQAEKIFDQYKNLYSNNEKAIKNKSNRPSAQESCK